MILYVAYRINKRYYKKGGSYLDYNNNLHYDIFLKQLKESLEVLTGDNTRILIGRALKNNCGLLDGIAIIRKDACAAPAIYLDTYYERYCHGASVSDLAKDILAFHSTHAEDISIDMEGFQDYEKIRGKIVCRLIGRKGNDFFLQQVPHCPFLDLEIIYCYLLESPSLGSCSILIRNMHLDLWDISAEKLHDDALSNTPRLLPYDFKAVSELLLEMLGTTPDEDIEKSAPLYVLTNIRRSFGSVNLIFPTILEAISEKLGGDYYVLPSSVHECIILPVENADIITEEKMQQMVEEINAESVPPEEILGASVYRYFKEQKNLQIVIQNYAAADESHP